MAEYVRQLKEDGKFIDAYIVSKNYLSKDPGNIELFQEFADLALEIANYNITIPERKQYISDAVSALALFSESAEMNQPTLDLIRETKARIAQVSGEISADEKAYLDELDAQSCEKNDILFRRLAELYQMLNGVNSQGEFDRVLAQVAEVEEQMDKTAFSPNQEQTYEKMTKQYSAVISRKMEALNHEALLGYNKRAVRCFNEVFCAFRREPSRYKAESDLKALMTSKFFTYDTAKLFNESLIFYNHVYSLVFQEVSDDLKYKLTEWALSTKKLTE